MTFVEGSGFARWADANRLVILFPQVSASVLNPKGCWDWWGYTGNDYLTKNAPQIAAIWRMVDILFAFQQALENRQLSDWLGSSTAGMGSYPSINVFQQGDDLVAIIELPGVNKADINIQAKGDTIRIAGRKSIDYPEDVSLHRRERLSGSFDRTLVVPMQIDPDAIKAEYNNGLLALFIPRAEQDKPRTIEIR